MKRIKVGLVALVAAIGMGAGVASPASAYISGDYCQMSLTGSTSQAGDNDIAAWNGATGSPYWTWVSGYHAGENDVRFYVHSWGGYYGHIYRWFRCWYQVDYDYYGNPYLGYHDSAL